jgi:hypothetical protein
VQCIRILTNPATTKTQAPGTKKSPVFVTPGFERDSEHDRESQAQVLIGKRIDGSGAILFLFSNLSFETRS